MEDESRSVPNLSGEVSSLNKIAGNGWRRQTLIRILFNKSQTAGGNTQIAEMGKKLYILVIWRPQFRESSLFLADETPRPLGRNDGRAPRVSTGG